LEDLGEQELPEVWEENTLAINVLYALETQWMHGFSGPTGLNYSSLPVIFDYMGVPEDVRSETFTKLQIAERVALTTMRKHQTTT